MWFVRLPFAYHIIAIALFLVGVMPAAAQEQESQSQLLETGIVFSDAEFRELAAQLDSPVAVEREQATDRLAKGTIDIAPAIAKLIATGSPEQQVRSARILQQIGVKGNRTTLLKVTRLLVLLSDNGHSFLYQGTRDLALRWYESRSELVIADLRKLGATIAKQTTHVNRMVTIQFQTLDGKSQEPGLKKIATIKPGRQEILDMIDQAAKEDEDLDRHAIDKSKNFAQFHHRIQTSSHSVNVAIIDENWKGVPSDVLRFRDMWQPLVLEIHRHDIDSEFFVALSRLDARTIRIQNCKLDAAELKRFVLARKKRAVEIRPNAVLGVRGQSTENLSPATNHSLDPCVIVSLIDGCPARAAGIEVGDLVTRIGDKEIGCFQDLVFDIAGREVGEEVVIQVTRDGEQMELKVKLGDSTGVNL